VEIALGGTTPTVHTQSEYPASTQAAYETCLLALNLLSPELAGWMDCEGLLADYLIEKFDFEMVSRPEQELDAAGRQRVN